MQCAAGAKHRLKISGLQRDHDFVRACFLSQIGPRRRRPPFRLSDKAEVQAEQEENEMRNGAQATCLWRKDNDCAQERHRHVCEVEVELNSAADEEGACEKLAYVSASIGKVQRR